MLSPRSVSMALLPVAPVAPAIKIFVFDKGCLHSRKAKSERRFLPLRSPTLKRTIAGALMADGSYRQRFRTFGVLRHRLGLEQVKCTKSALLCFQCFRPST